MSFLGEIRGTYVNPELSGTEALDPVYVVAQSYRPEDRTGVRQGVLVSGIKDGIPGHTRKGLMPPEDAMALVLKTEIRYSQRWSHGKQAIPGLIRPIEARLPPSKSLS